MHYSLFTMNIIESIILVPIIGGVLAILLKALDKEFAFLGALIGLFYATRIFFITRTRTIFSSLASLGTSNLSFRVDALSGFLILFIALLGFLILLYSFRSIRQLRRTGYYTLFLFTLSSSSGVVLAANFLTLLIFWGLFLSCLCGLFTIGKKEEKIVWTKTLLTVGISDFLIFLGIVIIIVYNGNLIITEPLRLSLNESKNIIPFLLIVMGTLTKASAFPLHTLIPEAPKVLPATTIAFSQGVLDKLLGIYLLTRISFWTFDLPASLLMRDILMVSGVVFILVGAKRVLRQKEMMRLFSLSALSEVGYIVLGIGTGIPIGIAGGLFYMLNTTLYNSCLFLTSGSIEHWTKESRFDNLGGLGQKMPLTFFSFLVSAMAISSIPPLNGFFSKWMVYQGVLSLQKEGNYLFPIFLALTIVGSILTIVYFLKLTYAVFLGKRPKGFEKVREVGFSMWLPTVIIAFFCIIFGIFVYPVSLKGFIYPALNLKVAEIGFFKPGLAAILVIFGIGIGFLLYSFRRTSRQEL